MVVAHNSFSIHAWNGALISETIDTKVDRRKHACFVRIALFLLVYHFDFRRVLKTGEY